MTRAEPCVRCHADALDVAELDDGTVCLGCLTIDEQGLLFIAATATAPPHFTADEDDPDRP